MQFAGTFAFQQRYKTAEVLQVQSVVTTGRVITVAYDGAVQTFLVWWRNARKLTKTAVAWNITLKLSRKAHLLPLLLPKALFPVRLKPTIGLHVITVDEPNKVLKGLAITRHI